MGFVLPPEFSWADFYANICGLNYSHIVVSHFFVHG